MIKQLFISLLLFVSLPASAEIQVVDDLGHTITLQQPAERIISLAPSITEMIFATGAGNKLVGVVSFSDYPAAAKKLPIIGGYQSPDYERIMAANPDLIIAWQSGNGQKHIDKLRMLGFTVYANESRSFADIPQALRNFSKLTGNETQGEQVALAFEQRLSALQQHYADRSNVQLFYQVWNSPLITINNEHIIGKVIQLCGGNNVFGHIDKLTPRPNLEAILQADPETIIASGMGNKRPDWLDEWQRWQQMQAVKNGHVYFLNADLINRPTPRILDAVQQMCELLDRVRHAQGSR